MGRLRWLVLGIGGGALVVAAAMVPTDARSAAATDWPAFVLVTGLLLLGRVARDDGLFDAAGALVARAGGGGWGVLGIAAVVVALVSALLNLDTAVVFVTPVLIIAARHRHMDEAPLLYLAVFLANGASLLLPGSNLTNLIVLGGQGTSGGSFAAHMFPAWVASIVVIVVVVALAFRRHLRTGAADPVARVPWPVGAGLVGVIIATAAMVALAPAPMALVVVATAAVVVGWRSRGGRLAPSALSVAVDGPVLLGLFGLAVAFGALGRSWSGPSHLLAHASIWETAGIGAATSVVTNNLPAASLLAARPLPHPDALLIGLNLGPNLAVTGALSAFLWIGAARSVAARPSAARFSRLGLVLAPVSLAAALVALAVFG